MWIGLGDGRVYSAMTESRSSRVAVANDGDMVLRVELSRGTDWGGAATSLPLCLSQPLR